MRLRRTPVRYCQADNIDVTVDCDLPEGHEGDHRCVYTWPQSETVTSLLPPVPGGMLMYLYYKYRLRNM